MYIYIDESDCVTHDNLVDMWDGLNRVSRITSESFEKATMIFSQPFKITDWLNSAEFEVVSYREKAFANREPKSYDKFLNKPIGMSRRK